MLELATIAGSASIGATIKIVGGILQHLLSTWSEQKILKAEREIAIFNALNKGQERILRAEKSLEGERVVHDEVSCSITLFGRPIGFNHRKRRSDSAFSYRSVAASGLAYIVAATFCAVCLLWAFYPDTPLIVQNVGAKGRVVEFFFFNYTFQPDDTISITTGSLTYSLVNFMSMILTMYFTPYLGRKI